jgi:hypothetical protein
VFVFPGGHPSFLACSFWARNGRERYPSKTRVRRNTVYIKHTVKTMSDADGIPALIEQPAPRSTLQRRGAAPCGPNASAMSSIVRSIMSSSSVAPPSPHNCTRSTSACAILRSARI